MWWVDPVSVVDNLTVISMKVTFSNYIGTPLVYMVEPTIEGFSF